MYFFFPQMRPEKKEDQSTDKEFIDQGIPAAYLPLLRNIGLNTLSQLSESNVNKLHNDLCGMRKKMKLKNLENPTKEVVQHWIEASQK